MTDTPPDPSPKLDIDWLRTLAGALAAVSTAVLLSTLGAAGTLIGAAVGSVAATVGTALYTQGLATSRQKVAKAQETALQKVGIAQAEVRRAARLQGDEAVAEAHLGHADEQLAEARDELDTDTAPGWRERLAALSWRRIGLLAGGTFVVVVLALLVFELVGGKPVSSFTGGTDGSGGTSISRLTGSGGTSDDGDRGDDGKQRERDDQAPDGEPSEGPTDGATEAPTEAPVETPTPSAEPSETPSETPAQTPTELGGTGEPAPSAPPAGPAG